jgi:hypothetical protein
MLEPQDNRGEKDEGMVGLCGLVVAGGDGAELLEAIDAALTTLRREYATESKAGGRPGRCARWRRWSARSGMTWASLRARSRRRERGEL